MFAYRPLPHYHGSLGDSFDLHLLGMWLSLVVAALVIAAFVARLAAALRSREAHLAQLREAALRGEQLAALGALAAGTAHELSTPLSTMAVLVGELRATAPPEQRAELDLLSQQIERCRGVLTRNLTVTGQGRAEGGGRLELRSWLTALVEQWRQTRPQATLQWSSSGPGEPPHVVADETLRQALFSLLDNAADASAAVEVCARWDAQALCIDIADRGPGVPRDQQQLVFEKFHQGGDGVTRPQGTGLGLPISRQIVEHFGGHMWLEADPGQGTCVSFHLPWNTQESPPA
jgi:two-component system sensor histidine kinase RegB